MNKLVSILLIGASLSMDTFSLSLSLSYNLSKTKYFNLLPFTVGIFHFLMPSLGLFLGANILKILNITSNRILGIILIILAINLSKSLKDNSKPIINLNIISIIILSFLVSIDSFTVGFCLSNFDKASHISSIIFAICSFSFTYIGLLIGKYTKKLIGNYSNLIGAILLLLLGIFYLFH